MICLKFRVGSHNFAFLFKTVKKILEEGAVFEGANQIPEHWISELLKVSDVKYNENDEYLRFVFETDETLIIKIPQPVSTVEIDPNEIVFLSEYSYRVGLQKFLVGIAKGEFTKEAVYVIDIIEAIANFRANKIKSK